MKEELLELLRTDPAFREEVRRQLLTDDLLALPGRFIALTESVGQLFSLLGETVGAVRDLAAAQQRTEAALQQQGAQIQSLITAQQRTEAQVQSLIEAQRHTTEELRWLVSWQRGESGRRDGERYERDTLRRAPVLFRGGQGGAPDQSWVQQRLTERLDTLMARDMFEAEEDPFLADLLWWKGEQVAVVEISLQVDGYDVVRAARRAGTLSRSGAQPLAVVIGESWATPEARDQAQARQVAWKVGSELSENFLTFRRVPSDAPGGDSAGGGAP